MTEPAPTPSWEVRASDLPTGLLDAALAAPAGREVLKRSPRRLVCRVEADGRRAVVKIHRRRGLVDRLLRRLGLDPATREAAALEHARAAGLPVPEVLAVCGRAPGGESRLLLADLGPTRDGHRLLAEADRTRLAAVGALVGRLHHAGLDHRDLHLGNLVEAGGRPHLLDFQAVTARGVPLGVASRRRGLTTLWLSARDAATPRQALRFLRGYLAAFPWPVPLAPRLLAADLDRRTLRLRVRSWRRREDRPFRECSEFTLEARPGRTTIRATYAPAPDAEAVRAALADPEALTLRHGRRGSVVRSRGLILKERDAAHARTLWRNHYRLRQRGLARAEALTLVLEGGRGVVAVTDLGPLPHLDEALRAADPGRREAILAALERAVSRLHATGLGNRDLKSPNLLVRENPLEVVMVDLDGLAPLPRLRPPRTRRIARDRARLARALAEAGS